ncbi:MAG: VanZ family protein [Hyphomicrobium sp.]
MPNHKVKLTFKSIPSHGRNHQRFYGHSTGGSGAALTTVLSIAMFVFTASMVAVLSLVPGEYRPQTGFIPDSLEHAICYCILGFFYCLAARRQRPQSIVLVIALFAAALELAQIYIPDRTADFGDFASSTIGGTVGVACASILLATMTVTFTKPLWTMLQASEAAAES